MDSEYKYKLLIYTDRQRNESKLIYASQIMYSTLNAACLTSANPLHQIRCVIVGLPADRENTQPLKASVVEKTAVSQQLHNMPVKCELGSALKATSEKSKERNSELTPKISNELLKETVYKNENSVLIYSPSGLFKTV